MYLNRVYLLGNLTQDPEVKDLPSGSSVTNFGLATNRSWTDQQGTKQETVEYHSVVAFGKPAEIIGKYLRKGSLILVEGRIQTRSWDAQDGTKKYKTEIVVESFQLGPKNASSGGGSSSYNKSGSSRPSSPAAKNSAPQEELPTVDLDEDEIDLEEIPF